jgi:hypothetical protein
LGTATKVKLVRVRWPGGTVEEWNDLRGDQYSTLKEGFSHAAAQRRNEGL